MNFQMWETKKKKQFQQKNLASIFPWWTLVKIFTAEPIISKGEMPLGPTRGNFSKHNYESIPEVKIHQRLRLYFTRQPQNTIKSLTRSFISISRAQLDLPSTAKALRSTVSAVYPCFRGESKTLYLNILSIGQLSPSRNLALSQWT